MIRYIVNINTLFDNDNLIVLPHYRFHGIMQIFFNLLNYLLNIVLIPLSSYFVNIVSMLYRNQANDQRRNQSITSSYSITSEYHRATAVLATNL